MTAPLIDLAAAARYLTALTGEDDPVVTWQTFDDVKTRKDSSLAVIRHGSLSGLTSMLSALNQRGAGVYVCISETDRKGREIENVTRLRALFIDVDGTAELPSTWRLQPSIVVQRDATHWHAYWLLVDDQAAADFAAAQVHLACAFLSDESVKDVTRVMRVPGFAHNKSQPLPVALIHAEHSAVHHSIAAVAAAHPVDYLTLSEVYQRAASRVGLCPAPEKPRAARAITQVPASQGEMARQDAAFRKWAYAKDTRASNANDNGKGNDTAAFSIAAEGYGRFQAGIISSEALICSVVEDFISRCGWANIDTETERLCRNARSKPREHHAVELSAPRAPSAAPSQRLASPPAASEDLFAGGSGARPPGLPPAAGADEPEAEKPFGGIDLDRLKWRWALTDRGVVPVELNVEGTHAAKPNKRVTGLPIWPERAGGDVASGATWWKLAWWTPRGETRMQWVSEGDMKLGHPLIALPDAPVTKRQAENVAVYLTEARAMVTQSRAEVTSRIGWCGVNGGRRWVFPGVGQDQAVEYIGGALPMHGKLDGWKVGLAHLLSDKLTGDQAYTALAVLCLSAAAPWSRLMGSRNAIIGLMGPSSSGKGSVIDNALAIWADPDLMRLPASSTAKGIQDRAIQVPDLPIMLDELQQLTELHPHATADALYFLANGQRRVTSSKERTSTGGERRYGVGFYAAEAPVLPGQNLGVLYRVIELDGRPCPDEATAKALQAGSQHTGTLAGPIAAIIGAKDVTAWVEDVRKRAAEMRSAQVGLTGDDPESLALIELGAGVLSQVTGLTLPTRELIAWLVKRVRAQRTNVVDRETQCLHQVMSTVLNQGWFEYGEKPDDAPIKKAQISVQGRPLAWRTYTAQGLTDKLDVDSLHREVQPLFVSHGGEPRVLRQWADRGWIERQGPHMKVRRRDAGRVVRFTNDAWKVFNQGTEPEVVVP